MDKSFKIKIDDVLENTRFSQYLLFVGKVFLMVKNNDEVFT
jgi:hypothetical protein